MPIYASAARSIIALQSLAFLGSCVADNKSGQGVQRITAADFTLLASAEALEVDLNNGDVRVDNTNGLIDLDRIQLIDKDGLSHTASELASRKFDMKDINHELIFSQVGDRPETTYALTNYQWVLTASSFDSTWWKSPEATCTGGRYMLGMGADTTSTSHILFRGMIAHNSSGVPYKNETAYHEDLTGNPANWQVHAYASCANAPAGLTVVHVDSATNSTATKGATATCPAGKSVLGVGGTIAGGDGRVKMDALVPGSNYAIAQASEDPVGTTANWYVRAYAICATAPSGLEIRHTSAAIGTPSVTLTCSTSSKVILGLGGLVDTSPTTNIGIGALVPVPTSSPPSGIVAFASYGTLPGSGLVHGYMICADP